MTGNTIRTSASNHCVYSLRVCAWELMDRFGYSFRLTVIGWHYTHVVYCPHLQPLKLLPPSVALFINQSKRNPDWTVARTISSPLPPPPTVKTASHFEHAFCPFFLSSVHRGCASVLVLISSFFVHMYPCPSIFSPPRLFSLCVLCVYYGFRLNKMYTQDRSAAASRVNVFPVPRDPVPS